MQKKTIDARGELCPKPLIMTKKGLKDFEGTMSILLDNETSYENVKRFLTDNGRTFTSAADGDNYTLTVTQGGVLSEMTAAEDYCPLPAPAVKGRKRGHVICFKSDLMGEGDKELGRILIQGFCNTIKETNPLPSTLVFYNSGIRLAGKDSPVLPALTELEQMGVKILVCGTCADYYEIKDQIDVGIISNMYDITNALTGAGHIINP